MPSRHAAVATSLLLVAGTGAVAAIAAGDATLVPPPSASSTPWSRPFSVVAGGGLQRPATGVVAGDADLGLISSGVRDGAGRIVIVSDSGAWIVRLDGRLAPVGGLPRAGRFGGPFRPGTLARLADGRVALGEREHLFVLAPGSERAGPLPKDDYKTVGTSPPTEDQRDATSAARLDDGRVLISTERQVSGELDRAPLRMAAGPRVDPEPFGHGVAEEYYGWVSRRGQRLLASDGRRLPLTWAGPAPRAIETDAASDVLVASGSRLWSTRAELGEPGIEDLPRGAVAVRLGQPALVTVTLRDGRGRLLSRTSPASLKAGTSTVRVETPTGPLTRVSVTARRTGRTVTAGRWAFTGHTPFTATEAARVLRVLGRRLNVGFEFAIQHGVDGCRARGRQTVLCRWTTVEYEEAVSERTVRLDRSADGYLLRAGPRRRGARPPKHLLGMPPGIYIG